MPKPEEKIGQKYTICYCRVSSAKQRDDLNRQVAYMREQYPDAEIVKEIGSGINFKRNGLCRILERAMRGDVITLVVAYKDRLARFGADIIEFVLNQNGGKLVVLNEVSLSPEEELTRDLTHGGRTDSRYDMINDMLLSESVKDDPSLEDLMEQYVRLSETVEEFF